MINYNEINMNNSSKIIKEVINMTVSDNPCPNCKEIINECACIRNKCVKCSNSIGNITFTVCDSCWDKK